MIFRRRLMLHNWAVRKRILQGIRTELINKFSDLYDFTNVSLRRDMLLLFLNQEELSSRLSFECKNLPLNQDTTLSNHYAIILQLRKIQIKNPPVHSEEQYLLTTSDVIDDRLREQYEFLQSRTNEVDSSWVKGQIQLDGLKHGFNFLAKDEKEANLFFEDFLSSIELLKNPQDPQYPNIYGYRAIGLIDEDPRDSSEDILLEERTLVSSVFKLYSSAPNKLEGVSLLRSIELEEIKNNFKTEVSQDTVKIEDVNIS